MELHYFSWLRNKVGTAKENISPPTEINTPQKLVGWLTTQEEKYQSIFEHIEAINISINDEIVSDWENHTINGDDKISFFSPMAGG